MKKDSFYFPHDSNAHDDPKIMILLSEWGLEGYGIYWILIEHLRNQKDYKAPLTILKPLAIRFGSSEEKFKTVVTRYELFEVDRKQNFFSSSLIRRMLPLEEKREKMRINALKRWESNNKGNAIALPLHTKSNASKEKKSKENNSNNIPPNILEVQNYCKERGNNVSPQKWYDFYSSKGWMIGKNKMKDWRAAVRTWENGNQKKEQKMAY